MFRKLVIILIQININFYMKMLLPLILTVWRYKNVVGFEATSLSKCNEL